MMGQMIIPEFQIFGEFLQGISYLFWISGEGHMHNYWGAMAPLAPPLSTSLSQREGHYEEKCY